jgi:hypothetical protein
MGAGKHAGYLVDFKTSAEPMRPISGWISHLRKTAAIPTRYRYRFGRPLAAFPHRITLFGKGAGAFKLILRMIKYINGLKLRLSDFI